MKNGYFGKVMRVGKTDAKLYSRNDFYKTQAASKCEFKASPLSAEIR